MIHPEDKGVLLFFPLGERLVEEQRNALGVKQHTHTHLCSLW